MLSNLQLICFLLAMLLALSQASVQQPDEHFMKNDSDFLFLANKANTPDLEEMMQFAINTEPTEKSLVRLYFHIDPAKITLKSGDNDNGYLLFTLSSLKMNGNGTHEAIPITQIVIPGHLAGWHNQELSPDVITGLMSNNIETGSNSVVNLHLSCLNCHYQVFPANCTKHNVPFLKVDDSKRVKRATTCSGSRCCKKDLNVNLDQLSGYDWVLHPRSWVANYCLGTCSSALPSHRSSMSTNNILLSDALRHSGTADTVSCCAPSSTTPINVVYQDINGIVRNSMTSFFTINDCQCT